ncbi:MAG: hypothetical protein KGL35_03730 [Bradyrhizobium sp.]|nr:hypothetical protein [Bradyrhizobium sp.]
MTFTAFLVRGSPIWRLWTDHHRTGGLVAGIRFHWTAGGDFATGELMPHQVGPLLGLADVRVEMITNAPLPIPALEASQQPESPSTVPAQQSVQQTTVPAQQPVQQTTVPAQQPAQPMTAPALSVSPQWPFEGTLRAPDRHYQHRGKGHRR